MFHGFDFDSDFDSDSTMLRIGSMNMLLHSVEKPEIRRRDYFSLEEQLRRKRVVAGVDTGHRWFSK